MRAGLGWVLKKYKWKIKKVHVHTKIKRRKIFGGKGSFSKCNPAISLSLFTRSLSQREFYVCCYQRILNCGFALPNSLLAPYDKSTHARAPAWSHLVTRFPRLCFKIIIKKKKYVAKLSVQKVHMWKKKQRIRFSKTEQTAFFLHVVASVLVKSTILFWCKIFVPKSLFGYFYY